MHLVIAYIEASLRAVDKAGNCTDPADDEAYAQLAVWLQAWKRSPQDPKTHLSLISRHAARHPTTEQPTRTPPLRSDVGAAPRSSRLSSNRDLVQPAFQDPSKLSRMPSKQFRSLNELDRLGQEAVMSKLADSTRKAYSTGWKQWELFMSGTKYSPFLAGETRAEKQADEAWLIRFVVFLHRTAQGINNASRLCDMLTSPLGMILCKVGFDFGPACKGLPAGRKRL